MMKTGPQRGFSVASILLLTAVISILMAALRGVFLQIEQIAKIPDGYRLGIPLASGLLGGFVGVFVASRSSGTMRAAVLGLGAGFTVGLSAGIVALGPGSLAVLGAGGAVILLFAVGMRLLSVRKNTP